MKQFIRFVFLMSLAFQANAEPLYVGDKLVVGVYPEIDSETGKLANLETGDAVEGLERQDKYIRVRLSDGREGWVKANYLTAQPPAIVRLKELQANNAGASDTPSPQVMQELEKLKEQNTALHKEVEALKAAAIKADEIAAAQATSLATSVAAANTVASPQAASPASDAAASSVMAEQISASASSIVIWQWLLGVLAAAAVGFLVGYQAFARRLRNKYGRVKII